MAVVGGEDVDLLTLGVEGEGEVPAVRDPEVAVEAPLQVGRLALQPVGERRVLPDEPGEARAAHLRVVRVPLQLAGRAREPRQPAVAVGDRVPRVLPALVLEARLLVTPLVPDVAGAEEVRVLVDPVERSPSLALELPHELAVARPPLVLVEQHDVQRRRVGAAVVRRVRTLLERRHLAVAHLVEDPARVLVTEVVDAAALPVPERAQRRRRELGRERQRLQAREDAVPAEHRHEPGQAGGRQAPPPGDGRREAQRRKVDEAAPVRRAELVRVALEPRRIRDPLLEAERHARPGALRSTRVLRPHVGSAGAGCRDDVEVRRPAARAARCEP